MQRTSLFFGFPVSGSYRHLLSAVRPELLALYINSGADMGLQEMTYQGQSFLGRHLGSSIDVEALTLQESNIVSFLKKIVPSYQYDKHPLLLLPTTLESS